MQVQSTNCLARSNLPAKIWILLSALHSPTARLRACWNTQTKSWIPVLETYWSIITSMAFQIILDQYQYSIKILNYFPVSLSVFKKKLKHQNLSIQKSLLTLNSNNFSKFASPKEVPLVSKIIFLHRITSLNMQKKLQEH